MNRPNPISEDNDRTVREKWQRYFRSYGLTDVEAEPIVKALSTRPQAWVDFMMRFELGLEKPDQRRALRSALTIARAYVAGGIIPLFPYLLSSEARNAY
jgi:VIT1/CCC1 family predicted Fe2+/Mn2+ transporter